MTWGLSGSLKGGGPFVLEKSYLLHDATTTLGLRPPPDLAEESKPSPAQKVKKESPGESLGESPRVLADPPKRVKNESPGDSASQKSPVF